MNTKTRFLVLDASNQPQRPRDHGLKLNSTQKGGSPSFLNEEEAVKFGQLLAAKTKENYYVARVTHAIGGADSLDALLANATTDAQGRPRASVSVVATSADGSGEEAV